MNRIIGIWKIKKAGIPHPEKGMEMKSYDEIMTMEESDGVLQAREMAGTLLKVKEDGRMSVCIVPPPEALAQAKDDGEEIVFNEDGTVTLQEFPWKEESGEYYYDPVSEGEFWQKIEFDGDGLLVLFMMAFEKCGTEEKKTPSAPAWVPPGSDGGIARLLQPEASPDLLASAAKEVVLSDGVSGKTAVRIEKNRCALLVWGDRILTDCSRAGDFLLEGTEALPKAKVYFVRTGKISGKIFETATPIVYRATCGKVTGEIRLRCTVYFEYRVKNPKTFLRYVLEQKGKKVSRTALEGEMNSVFMACLPDVFEEMAEAAVPYTEVCGQTETVTEIMRKKLKLAWQGTRGIELRKYVIAMAEPNKKDEKAFLEACNAEEAKGSSDGFSEEFDAIMKELGRTAGEAINAFQDGMTSLFGELSAALDREMGTSDGGNTDSEDDDFFRNFIENGSNSLLGTWECPEWKQTLTLALLDACITLDGREIWRGEWAKRTDEGGVTAVFCPTDDRIGPYAYFEYRSQSGEDAPYLAGILSHSEEETQYVRFVRSAEN